MYIYIYILYICIGMRAYGIACTDRYRKDQKGLDLRKRERDCVCAREGMAEAGSS